LVPIISKSFTLKPSNKKTKGIKTNERGARQEASNFSWRKALGHWLFRNPSHCRLSQGVVTLRHFMKH